MKEAHGRPVTVLAGRSPAAAGVYQTHSHSPHQLQSQSQSQSFAEYLFPAAGRVNGTHRHQQQQQQQQQQRYEPPPVCLSVMGDSLAMEYGRLSDNGEEHVYSCME